MLMIYNAAVVWLSAFISIYLHECGHYIAARCFGITADAPWVRFRHGLPMGGRVRCRGFLTSTVGRLTALVLAGPLTNVFLAAISFTLVDARAELYVLGTINIFCAAMSWSDYREAARLLSIPVEIDFDAQELEVGGKSSDVRISRRLQRVLAKRRRRQAAR